MSDSLERGKALAAKLRAERKKYKGLAAREDKIQRLTKMGVAGNKERKKMRDVYYDTDGRPSAGAAWNPQGKLLTRGSSAKCDRINSGLRAKAAIPR